MANNKIVDYNLIPSDMYMAPEGPQGSRYAVSRVVWSLGLSLVELAIGRFPIPAPDINELTQLASTCTDHVLRAAAKNGCYLPPLASFDAHAKPMCTFELLKCIVSDQPPALAPPFSAAFCAFVSACLRKNPKERLDLKSLTQHQFVEALFVDASQKPPTNSNSASTHSTNSSSTTTNGTKAEDGQNDAVLDVGNDFRNVCSLTVPVSQCTASSRQTALDVAIDVVGTNGTS